MANLKMIKLLKGGGHANKFSVKWIILFVV